MRWLLCAVLAVGCAADGGANGTESPSVDGGTDSAPAGGDGSIFPSEDAVVEDSALEDTSTPSDVAPSCGLPGLPCCAGACTTGYCHEGSCFAKPEVLEETSDPGLCADLAVAHVAPAFLARYTLHGRPNALAYRYYKKLSCPSPVATLTAESPVTLGTDGTYIFTLENPAISDCTNSNVGKYEVWVVVDGIETAHHVVTSYVSSCSTCAGAALLCP